MTNSIPSASPGDAVEGDVPADVADIARELGLKPIRAWVSDDSKKAGTVGAQRTRRCREKAEQLGLKQLSVTLPVELHALVKTLAARTKAGEPPEVVVAELVRAASPSCKRPAAQNSGTAIAWLDSLPAWRRWLLRWLLPAAGGPHMP